MKISLRATEQEERGLEVVIRDRGMGAYGECISLWMSEKKIPGKYNSTAVAHFEETATLGSHSGNVVLKQRPSSIFMGRKYRSI